MQIIYLTDTLFMVKYMCLIMNVRVFVCLCDTNLIIYFIGGMF